MCKGEVCGACTGALMALGLKYGQSDIEDLEYSMSQSFIKDLENMEKIDNIIELMKARGHLD